MVTRSNCSADALSRVRLVGRLSSSEAKDVENVVSEIRAKITRERISLRPGFKVGRRTPTHPRQPAHRSLYRHNVSRGLSISLLQQTISVKHDARLPLLCKPSPEL